MPRMPNGAILRSLLTTTGDIIAASAVGTPARVAAPAAGQVLTGQGAGVLPAWAAAAAGAVTRAGGNTTEATTTSTAAVDLLSVASLSIATNVPILLLASGRTTTGAALGAGLGLKMNATVTGEASVGAARILGFQAEDIATFRSSAVKLPARITNYNGQGSGHGIASGLGNSSISVGASPTITAAQPIATITDLVIRAISGSGLITVGADEMHVYTYAVS